MNTTVTEHGLPFVVQCALSQKRCMAYCSVLIYSFWIFDCRLLVDFFVLDLALFYFDALIDELMEAVEPSQ